MASKVFEKQIDFIFQHFNWKEVHAAVARLYMDKRKAVPSIRGLKKDAKSILLDVWETNKNNCAIGLNGMFMAVNQLGCLHLVFCLEHECYDPKYDAGEYLQKSAKGV